jgi:hypothetical protein
MDNQENADYDQKQTDQDGQNQNSTMNQAHLSYTPQPYSYAQSPAVVTGNGQAVASLILGITCILFSWWGVFTLAQVVLAIVFGASGRKRAARTGQGGGMATAGLVLGIVGCVIYILFGIFSLGVGFLI